MFKYFPKRDITALHLLQKMGEVLQDDSKGPAVHSKVIILLLCVLLQVYRHLQDDRGQVWLSVKAKNWNQHQGRSWTLKQLHSDLHSLLLSLTWLLSCEGSSVCCQVMQAGWKSFGGVASATMTFSCERTIPQSRATEMAVSMLSPCGGRWGSGLVDAVKPLEDCRRRWIYPSPSACGCWPAVTAPGH